MSRRNFDERNLFNKESSRSTIYNNAMKWRDRSRSRSRSRSPDDRRDKLERDRKARMARLRAENEAEERRLAVLGKNEEEKKVQAKAAEEAKLHIVEMKESDLEGLDEEQQMQRLLGFTGFDSTKGQSVDDNKLSAASGAASKNKARKYRQYMNRKGGFNRPLDKMT